MSGAVTDFVERARAVSLIEAAERLGLKVKQPSGENPQPCPVSGGKDRFSINPAKKAWHCRHCGVGGHDGIGMAAHNLELDPRTLTGLLEACSAVLGEDIPEGGERESDQEREERRARLDDARRKAQAEAEAHAAGQADFREKERRKARGIHSAATELRSAAAPFGRFYLRGRACGVPDDRWLRVSADQTYWHGTDGRGMPASLHVGPAMIAPFVTIAADLSVEIIGCHITWIDLRRPPKLRPLLADPETGEVLPTKKMRGTKKGGVIPLCGHPSAARWLGGEGIENTLAFGGWEGFRADTFYFAAGDLGNMCGPAADRFAHPVLKKADRTGRMRAVMVSGPTPRFSEDGEAAAMPVPDHVEELVLLADGDSEPVMTAAAMVRARARHGRPGRLIPVLWPGEGRDWAALAANADGAFESDGADA